MVLGSICTQLVGTDTFSNWSVFLVLLLIHQWSNYHLVRTLVLDTLNPQRCYLLVRLLLNPSKEQTMDYSPLSVAKKEQLFTPLWLASHGPILGGSLESILMSINSLTETTNDKTTNDKTTKDTTTTITFESLQQRFAQESYLVGFDIMGRPVICLEEGCTQSSMLRAYLQCCGMMLMWEGKSCSLSQRFLYVISTDFHEYNYYVAMYNILNKNSTATSSNTTTTPHSTRSRSNSRTNKGASTTSSSSSSSMERIEDIFLRQYQWDLTPGTPSPCDTPYCYLLLWIAIQVPHTPPPPPLIYLPSCEIL